MHLVKLTSSILTLAILTACGGGKDKAAPVIEIAPITQSKEAYNQEKLAQIVFIPAAGSIITLGEEVTSEAITIDISGEEKISIKNGEYSIDGGKFTSDDGTITNGVTLVIKQLIPNEYDTEIATIVTIGTTSITFINKTGNAPDGDGQIPDGAAAFKMTCQPNTAACSNQYNKIAYYDSHNTLVNTSDLIREQASFAEVSTDKISIALLKQHENSQKALVFLSLDNEPHEYSMVKGGVLPHYEPSDCKSYSVALNGLAGYELHPGNYFLSIKNNSFDIVEYDKLLGTAKVNLTSCANEAVVISELNPEMTGSPAVSYVELPIKEINEGDDVTLTMLEPTLLSVQSDNAELAFITSFAHGHTAYNTSTGRIGKDSFYLYPTQDAQYTASFSSFKREDNDNFINQYFNFSEIPENNLFTRDMYDIEIENVDFDKDAFVLNYTLSGNDSPSLTLFDLRITYEIVVAGVNKQYYTRTSIFSQHKSGDIKLPNVHEEFIPDGAQITEITADFSALKTTYFVDLKSAMGFGINAHTYSPFGFSAEENASAFYTKEYYKFIN